MIASWVKQQKLLIDLERDSEIAQLSDKISSLGAKDCQNEGLSILNLEIEGTRTALFGRCSIILQKMDKKQIQSAFKVGDEVNLYNPKLKTTGPKADNTMDNGTVFGLVSKVTSYKIEMIVEDFDENAFDAPLRLDLRSNQKTHNKMIEAISSLETSDHPLVNMLFSPKDQSLDYRVVVQDVKLDRMFNSGLNASQIDAIKCALGSLFVSLIHGPPGTGKTSTLTELILQAVQKDLKVLVCAPSNIAVDTILARLADSVASPSAAAAFSGRKANNSSSGGSSSNNSGDYRRPLNMVRLGHPARISANILNYSLDSLIESDEGTEIVQDVRKEIDDLRKTLSTRTKKKPDYALRREQRSELRALCKEARTREKTVVQRILARSNVVLSTCIGASSKLLSECEFDLVVIDEAAQGLEAACWVPLLLGKKCVLAGDHCQLPPTIKSDAAVKDGLAVTLFERIISDSRFAPEVKLLNTQYRMNDLISQWASKEMYGGRIQSDASVASHTLRDILPGRPIKATRQGGEEDAGRQGQEDGVEEEDGEEEQEEQFPVMLLVDTAGCGMVEEQCAEKSSGSHRNIHEAQIVVRHIQALLKAGVQPSQIGVITPYNGQLEVLRNMIMPVEDARDDDKNKSNGSSGSASGALKLSSAVSAAESAALLPMTGVDVKTIDGFQGGEKECIIISMVRSNDSRTVGFLSDTRRMNVAVTRAKRHVAVVCDTDTCGTNAFIHSLIEHMAEHGEHISAYEYMDTVDAGSAAVAVVAGGGKQSSVSSVVTVGEMTTGTGSVAESVEVSSSAVDSQTPQTVFHSTAPVAAVHNSTVAPSSSAQIKKPVPLPKNLANSSAAAAKTAASNKRSPSELDFRPLFQSLLDGTSGYGRVIVTRTGQIVAPSQQKLLQQHDGAPTSSNSNSSCGSGSSSCGKQQSLVFPSSMNSYQRMTCHDLAGQMGLHHRSQGEGALRFVEVSQCPFVESEKTEVAVVSEVVVMSKGSDPVGSGLTEAFSESTDLNNEEGLANTAEEATSELQRTVVKVSSAFDALGGGDDSDNSSSDDDEGSDGVGEQRAGTLGSAASQQPKASTGNETLAALARERNARRLEVERGNSKTQSAALTAARADQKTKKSKPKSKGKSKAGAAAAAANEATVGNAATATGDDDCDDDDIDAILNAAIAENQRLARLNQYRVTGTAPMPNHERNSNKKKLQDRLAESQSARRVQPKGDGDDGKAAGSSTGGNGKKVLKKPPPNFGGGKLGTK